MSITISDQKHIQSTSFEESDFNAGDGFAIDCLRWYRQFIALLEKNVLIYKRRPLYSVVSLCLPPLVVLVFLLGNKSPSSGSSTSNVLQQPSNLQGLGSCDAYNLVSCIQIAYAPINPAVDDVMNQVIEYNGLDKEHDVMGFYDYTSLQTYVASNLGSVQFSVFFLNESLWYFNGSPQQPNTSSYVIYYNVSQDLNDNRSDYHEINFPLLVLQKSIEQAMLQRVMNQNRPGTKNVTYEASYAQTWSFQPPEEPDLNPAFNNMTCPTIEKDQANTNAAAPLVFAYAFQLVSLLAFQVITEERHRGLVKSLRTLGLYSSVYWISWMLFFMTIALIASIFTMILAAILRPFTFVLQHLDFSVLFLLVWLGQCCSYANALFLSSFVPAGNLSSAIVFGNFLLVIMTLVAFTFSLGSYFPSTETVNGVEKFVCDWSPSLFVSSAYIDPSAGGLIRFIFFWMPWYLMGRVLSDALQFIQYGITFTYADALNSITYYGATVFTATSTSFVFGEMALSSIIYIILAWFFSQLADGVPLSVIVVPQFVRRYMLGLDNEVVEGDYRGMERQRSEEEQSIRAYKVSKTFKTVQALKEVSFQIKKGEVFCLLGHNGAGKSTLFNILSGVLPTSHGKVFLLGRDVEYEMLQIQQFIGICQQHDYLWNELTAMEHMRLFARFKGLRVGPKLDAACTDVLSLVGLAKRSDTMAKNFSGGMKRRLSASMSIVGSVKVLFLDEPTTGLDPLSRRAIWDMISIMKRDRVVILTTHNLEEADYLSDRIMILQNGQVKALGDGLYLKQHYGTGFQIRMIVEPSVASLLAEEIVKYLPRSVAAGDISAGNIVVRVNKLDYHYLGRFLGMLELVQKSNSTVVKEWTISNTTLEQVFLTLCESASTNYSGAESVSDVKTSDMCPFCEKNVKVPISVLPYPAMDGSDRQWLLMPNCTCQDCPAVKSFAITNEEYELTRQEDEAQRRSAITGLLKAAQGRVSNALNIQINGFLNPLFEEAKESSVVEVEQAVNAKEVSSPLINKSLPAETISDNLIVALQEVGCRPSNVSLEGDNIASAARVESIDNAGKNVIAGTVQRADIKRIGSTQDAVLALMIKNIRLQARQKWCTCCALLYVVVMLLLMVMFGLIIIPNALCPQGYLLMPTQDCNAVTLGSLLFAVNTTIAEYRFYGEPVTNFNFSFYVYLVPPSSQSYNLVLKANPNAIPYGYYVAGGAGIPVYPDRLGTIWASNVNASYKNYFNRQSLYFPTDFPAANGNEQMFSQQKLVYDTVQEENPSCPAFASVVYNPHLTTSQQIAAFQASKYSDAIFACNSCNGTDRGYFNGTVWVADVVDTESYPFAFVNGYSYYETTNVSCPNVAGYQQLFEYYNLNFPPSYFAYYTVNQTVQAMSFLNMLTNSMYDPTLTNYVVQGGVSFYNIVNYQANDTMFLYFILSLLTALAMTGLFPMAIWRLSYERTYQLRTMMNSIGLKDPIYVLGMFTFDMITMGTLNLLIAIVVVAGKLSLFAKVPMGYLIATMVMYAFSLCGMAFTFVRVFPGNSRLATLVATVISLLAVLVSSFLCLILYTGADGWPKGLSIIPFFAVVRSMWVLMRIEEANSEVSEAIGFMFIIGVVCMLLEVSLSLPGTLSDYWHAYRRSQGSANSQIRNNLNQVGSSLPSPEEGLSASDAKMFQFSNAPGNADSEPVIDEDVAIEKRLIENSSPGTYKDFAIVVRNLRMEFNIGGAKPLVAVKNLSCGFRFGEVFGLLGPNGAGKSTTIAILSGILHQTSGDVYIAGENIREVSQTRFQNLVGICQQGDIVWDTLSVLEHLCFQARLRGIPHTHIRAEAQRVAVKIGLDGDTYLSAASTLSGGQRRRLSIGMSIVADPPIIFLDEPSAGLDPATRLGLWQLINSLRDPSRLILLTTHSMEEAETLCTRLGVLAEGQLQCLGTSIHLKKKFGTGYTLELNIDAALASASTRNVHSSTRHASAEDTVAMKSESASTATSALSVDQDIDAFLLDEVTHGAGVHLLSAINLTRKYMIPKENVNISGIWDSMEMNKRRLGVTEWRVSETTLEDIFISLVLKSRGEC